MDAMQKAREIERTAKRLYDGLRASGISEVEDMCAVLGAVTGSFAAATGVPEQAMERINLIARGIIDGSLLEP